MAGDHLIGKNFRFEFPMYVIVKESDFFRTADDVNALFVPTPQGKAIAFFSDEEDAREFIRASIIKGMAIYPIKSADVYTKLIAHQRRLDPSLSLVACNPIPGEEFGVMVLDQLQYQ